MSPRRRSLPPLVRDPAPTPRASQKTADQGGAFLQAQHQRALPTPGTPRATKELARIRAEGKQAAQQKQREDAFHERRLKLYRALETRVAAGKMTSAQAHAKLQKAGYVPGGTAFKEPTGVGGAIAKTVGGVVGVGEAVGKHAAHAVMHPGSNSGAIVPASYAKAHPGGAGYEVDKRGRYHLRDVSAGMVSGPSIAAQTLTGLARDATYNPGGVEQAIVHPRRTAEHVAKNLGELARHPERHPDQALLAGWALASGGGSALSRLGGAAGAVRKGEGLAAAVKRPGHEGGSLLHSPEPGTQPLYVRGHKPAVGPENAQQVDRLLSRNPVARRVQKANNRRIQRALDKGAPAKPPKTVLGRFARDNFSAQATVGREIRASRRVANAIERAPITQQRRSVGGALGVRGLSHGENAAINVIAHEGADAFRNPTEVLGRHIATHEHFAAIGGAEGAAANRAYIADLKQAMPVLQNPSKRFLRIVEDTRMLSHHTERELISRGHLGEDIAHGRRAKIADIYGRKAPAEDGFFVPMSRRYTSEAPKPPQGAYNAQPGQYGAGPVQEGRYVPGLHKQFSGESVAAGERPSDVAAAIAHRAGAVDRLNQASDFYDHLWHIGADVSRSAHDIPIRSTKQVQTELKKLFADLGDRLHVTPEEMANLDHGEVTKLLEHLDASKEFGSKIRPGLRAEGVRWVDSRYIKDLGETSVRGPFEKAFDTITNPARSVQLYTRPAYALNAAGNAAVQTITQGHLAASAMRKAVTAQRSVGREGSAIVDSIMGNSHSRSLSINTGIAAKANHQAAEFWNTVTDLFARRSAFFHEAGKAGFKTDAQLQQLLHDPKRRAKLVEVGRRANKNMIDYGSLTPLEQNAVRRVIYFYPFLSRAAIWTLRTLVEHPGKSFTLAQLALIGEKNANKRIGPMSQWERDTGFIPIGKPHGGLQDVANPMSINNTQPIVELGRAAIDTGKAVAGMKHGGGLGDVLTPSASLFTGAGTQSDFSGKPGGLVGVAQQTPEYTLGVHAGLWGKQSKYFPETGVGPAVGPFMAGGLFPRGLSQTESAKAARKERRAKHKHKPAQTQPAMRTPYLGGGATNSGGRKPYLDSGGANSGGRVPYLGP